MTPSRLQQIETIFNAAMQRDPDDRPAFLNEACAGDAELGREVQSLLAEASSSTRALDSNAWKDAITAKKLNQNVLQAGMQLGPYKIEGPLGAGGMGQVFRAVDTRLGRVVAIKTVQERFSERFEREARAISALNHPHICTLYDVGSHGSGTPYLVMEMVEGETLASRIERGKLSIVETLKCGQQIAEALAAAHAAGVVHRDLKPANVMLTKGGAKVLDFGLAKSAQDDTLTSSQGIMGTQAYMAPEQFDRKDADARTDIYALGLVLYEMASGKRAVRGEVPPMDALPPQFAHVVERCLKQDPDDRWQAARDVAAELKWIAGQPAPARTSKRAFVRWLLPIALASTVVLSTIVVLYFRTTVEERPVQFSLPLDRTAYADVPRVSPDGSVIVYTAVDSSGRRQLWLRRLDSDDAKPVTGTDDALYPFWSPDGRWIGFYAQRKLKKISRDGGSPQTIVAIPAFDGTAAWSSTGEILYGPGNRTPLYRIPDTGGTPQEVTTLDATRGENSHRLVRFLPDGKHFLFSARCTNRENNALYSGSLDTGEFHRVAAIQSNVAYAPPHEGRAGMLIFAREDVLYQQPFNGRTLSGEAAPLGNVDYRPIGMQAFFDLSLDGRVLLSRPPYATEENLIWFDRKGANAGVLGPAGTFQQPKISPDGNRVIFNRPDDNGGNRDVWLIETLRGTAARLTVTQENEWGQIWAPDGRRIAFASDRNGHRDGSSLEKTSMDPGAQETPVEGLPEWANPEDWSADGKWIAFSNGAVHGDIWTAPTFGDRKPFRFFDSGFEDRIPRFSPDGKWIAYHSNESGRFEVYVRPFEGKPAESGRKIQISLQGGYYATWNRNGKELFFLGPDSKLYVVSMANLGHSDAIPVPQVLFTACPGSTPTGASTQGANFDVSPDGLKFLFVCSNELPNKYIVTANWYARK